MRCRRSTRAARSARWLYRFRDINQGHFDSEAGQVVRPLDNRLFPPTGGTFRGPGYKNFDLAVSRSFTLQHGVRPQVRADFFNLFNITNYSNPLMPNFSTDFLGNGISANVRGVGYLALSATPDVAVDNPFLAGGGPRNIQLSAKITF